VDGDCAVCVSLPSSSAHLDVTGHNNCGAGPCDLRLGNAQRYAFVAHGMQGQEAGATAKDVAGWRDGRGVLARSKSSRNARVW